MEWLAFALLGAALLAFLVSTRQLAWRVRAGIWAGGVLLLGGAAAAALFWPGHAGLFKMLEGLVRGDSIAARALPRDWPSVAGAVAPMIDIFLIFAAVLAVVALAAFTPGEGVEKAVRPVIIGVLGALGGAFLALTLVATGFAGYFKHRFYVSDAVEVYDGDTIRVDDVSLRLAGIDAPERRQTCVSFESLAMQCGEDSRQHLIALTKNAIVFCEPVSRAGAPPETFGRPIVQCFAKAKTGGEFDLGRAMVADGYAALFEGGPEYRADFDAAQRQNKGILSYCTITPAEWRNNSAARVAFESYNPGLLPGAATIGACDALRVRSGGR